MTLIAQITDMHIRPSGKKAYQVVDTEAMLRAAVSSILAQPKKPDLVLGTGDDGKPSLHMHAVLGLKDGTTRGGHFLKGIVRPTLEVTIVETPVHLRRRKQPALGIALIEL